MTNSLVVGNDRLRAADALVRQLAELVTAEGKGDPARLEERLKAVLRQSGSDYALALADNPPAVPAAASSLDAYLPLMFPDA